jgi:5-methylcytosine-specific restriction enzyme subunit McrC
MQIPILNIYYLLCYSWDKLEEGENLEVKNIDSTELIDLFAMVLSNGLSRLLKQGLDRYYIDQEHLEFGIKGKLNLTATIKRNTLPLHTTICDYDEFDYDVIHNRILKTTVSKLLRSKNLDGAIKEDLRKLYVKLPPITEINIRNAHFDQIRLHRNNHHYGLLLNVCRILNDHLFLDESAGEYIFKDFLRDEKALARLFESFLFNFYNKESGFLVSSDTILWKYTADIAENMKRLPEMLTDVTLRSGNRKIILEAKYYKQAFQTHYDKETLRSQHLFQLFAYLCNQEDGSEITQNCEGILIYPTIETHFEYRYHYNGHKIKILSINLNQHWSQIKADLLDLIEL